MTWAVALLAASATAQPHGHQRRHNHKRVAAAADAVPTVYVDQHGNKVARDAAQTVIVTVTATVHTVTKKVCGCTKKAGLPASSSIVPAPPVDTPAPVYSPAPEPTSSPAPAPAPPTSSAAPAPAPPASSAPAPAPPASSAPAPAPEPTTSSTPAPAPQPTTSAAPAPPASSSTTPAPPASSSVAAPAPSSPATSYTPGTYPSTGKMGIVYSPYNDDHSCKTYDEVAADIAQLSAFSPFRLYGVDCNQVQNVIKAGKQYGAQVFAGIYNVDKAAAELDTLIKAVDGQWDSVHTVAIGNEVVNFNKMTADGFAGLINSSRQTLRTAGWNGPVVGVDTFVAIMSNPQICEASDYVAANCHSFFDGNVDAAGSGTFLDNMKAEMAKKCGSKKIVITETGWPTQGGTNGKAVPGVANQAAALKSIVETQGKDVILFTAFNDMWKTNTALTLGAEQFWGIQDKAALLAL
ncbi:Similar to Probable family 17 glucosidase SCW4; acc. no. P53334 [Pyronema omphalodes CBS 100304]|uniref:Similar to Probable family 17 glucosidase SCW4 acc. no. P53334 n=1 Tax=Pyronema omphalodes (strain CBS 100304) TaxID=1076935 RepID=U4LM94_PYROM|nr:Similar to Probable family 17 glucosidase SCW4; acc. no. P53334 [Pyronema omphalodes CBS 100304]